MRRVMVGFATDAVDMDMHDGVSITSIQETQEDRLLMARSGRSWVLEMRSSGGRDDSLLCLLWHRHQSSSPPLPSSARLSSAWTQNYSLILRPDCLIAHWRFWRLVTVAASQSSLYFHPPVPRHSVASVIVEVMTGCRLIVMTGAAHQTLIISSNTMHRYISHIYTLHPVYSSPCTGEAPCI